MINGKMQRVGYLGYGKFQVEINSGSMILVIQHISFVKLLKYDMTLFKST